MSYYYTYYIGVVCEGKIYLPGPYDSNGKLHCVLSVSRSFASDLHDRFKKVSEHMISDELRKEFEYEDWKGERCFDLSYLPLSELPKGSYIKSGYFLIEDVEYYEKNKDTSDIFYDKMSPVMYAERLKTEVVLGAPPPKRDCEGNEIEQRSCCDYMYYCYPDYHSKEYEADVLRCVVDVIDNYDDSEFVILLLEG